MTSVSWKAASSVIVLSRSTSRILMMRRGSKAKFMPNAFVFPGGVTNKSDEKIGPPTKISALRELFEETGLLVTKEGVESAIHSPELKILQDKTRHDPSAFGFITKSPPLDRLIDWSTWLTPTSHSHRFMTSFFIVVINDESPVRMCEKEMSQYIWVKPSECLEKAFLGNIMLPPPQVYELTRIDQAPHERLVDYTNSSIICPQHISWSSKSRISNIFPGDHLYIEENSFHQPLRTMDDDAVKIDYNLPTHREEYKANPMWAECKIFRHKLHPKYDSAFQSFKCHSNCSV